MAKYYNEARGKATQKYVAKALDRFEIKFKKGAKDFLKAKAAENGTSVNGLITLALLEKYPDFVEFAPEPKKITP